jgi:hypothetical protein
MKNINQQQVGTSRRNQRANPPQYTPPQSYTNIMTIKATYLLLYNILFSTLWLRILLGVIAALLSSTHPSPIYIYPHLEAQTRWTQTLAIAEIVHTATGLFGSPTPTPGKANRNTQGSPAPQSSRPSLRSSRAASKSGPSTTSIPRRRLRLPPIRLSCWPGPPRMRSGMRISAFFWRGSGWRLLSG